jgi:hypothetical protein
MKASPILETRARIDSLAAFSFRSPAPVSPLSRQGRPSFRELNLPAQDDEIGAMESGGGFHEGRRSKPSSARPRMTIDVPLSENSTVESGGGFHEGRRSKPSSARPRMTIDVPLSENSTVESGGGFHEGRRSKPSSARPHVDSAQSPVCVPSRPPPPAPATVPDMPSFESITAQLSEAIAEAVVLSRSGQSEEAEKLCERNLVLANSLAVVREDCVSVELLASGVNSVLLSLCEVARGRIARGAVLEALQSAERGMVLHLVWKALHPSLSRPAVGQSLGTLWVQALARVGRLAEALRAWQLLVDSFPDLDTSRQPEREVFSLAASLRSEIRALSAALPEAGQHSKALMGSTGARQTELLGAARLHAASCPRDATGWSSWEAQAVRVHSIAQSLLQASPNARVNVCRASIALMEGGSYELALSLLQRVIPSHWGGEGKDVEALRVDTLDQSSLIACAQLLDTGISFAQCVWMHNFAEPSKMAKLPSSAILRAISEDVALLKTRLQRDGTTVDRAWLSVVHHSPEDVRDAFATAVSQVCHHELSLDRLCNAPLGSCNPFVELVNRVELLDRVVSTLEGEWRTLASGSAAEAEDPSKRLESAAKQALEAGNAPFSSTCFGLAAQFHLDKAQSGIRRAQELRQAYGTMEAEEAETSSKLDSRLAISYALSATAVSPLDVSSWCLLGSALRLGGEGTRTSQVLQRALSMVQRGLFMDSTHQVCRSDLTAEAVMILTGAVSKGVQVSHLQAWERYPGFLKRRLALVAHMCHESESVPEKPAPVPSPPKPRPSPKRAQAKSPPKPSSANASSKPRDEPKPAVAVPRGSHYEVLGVACSAPGGDIKRAFRKLAKSLHPDKARQAGLSEAEALHAAERFKRVTAAYEVLSDEARRKEYDSELAATAPPAPSSFPTTAEAVPSSYAQAFSRKRSSVPNDPKMRRGRQSRYYAGGATGWH